MKSRSKVTQGIQMLGGVLRIAFLILIVGFIVAAYYLQTEGRLLEVFMMISMDKILPFIITHWYELGVSIILFSLGFWCGRLSMMKK